MKKSICFFLFCYVLINLYNLSYAKNKISKKFSGCNNIISKNYLNFKKLKIKKIEIDVHNYKSWTVNNIRIITSNSRFIPNNLKKRFEATIKVSYENNIFCILKGRVRHSGDAKDHIALKDNSIIQSLDISLDHGNIKGVTRFKLFKPDVRGVLEDVIIQTQILRDLGYLAPRSIRVKTRVNETESVMLFQEKAAKELLEFNNRREGPILEGDQRFFFDLVKNIPDNNLSNWSVGTPTLRNKSSKVMLSKLTNANLTNKGEIHKQISLDAINKLNLIYLYWSNRFQDKKNNFYFFDYDLDNTLLSLFDEEKIIKLEMYNLFMQSTNSHHALSASNRKFYWNSIENFFEPIMYDANPNIDMDFSSTTTAKIRFPISNYYDVSFENLDQKLSNIDIKKLYNYVNYNGLSLSENEIRRKLKKIRNNLKIIKKNFKKNIDQEKIKYNTYKYKKNILENFNKNIKEINPKTILVKKDNNAFYKCEIYLENCVIYDILDNDLIQLLEGELIKKKINYQFIGQNTDLNYLSLKQDKNIQNFLKTTIFFDKGIDLEVDQNKNIITINQKDIGARAYIINGSLEDTTIIFNGVGVSKDVVPPNYPIDAKGLTGCLSLINLNLNNINISVTNSNCEDSINLINSSGTVNKIFIKNSYSDALDVDFSKLVFNQIDVLNANNDCADFSYGKYSLSNLKLDNCGDKAVSIGETSDVKIMNIKINKAKIGIATKDSSSLKLKGASINYIDTCLSAYNKKQEFAGAYIKATQTECKNFSKKFKKDNLSEIIFDNNRIKKN